MPNVGVDHDGDPTWTVVVGCRSLIEHPEDERIVAKCGHDHQVGFTIDLS